MAAHFFESSGLVKRYVNEVGSAWVRRLTDPHAGHQTYIVRITAVEVVSALVRKQPPIGAASLAAGLRDFQYDSQNQYQVIEVTEPLIAQAMVFAEKHRLRGYDAVQLAAAVRVNQAHLSAGLSAVMLISSDVPLNAAAQAEGIRIDDPTGHP